LYVFFAGAGATDPSMARLTNIRIYTCTYIAIVIVILMNVQIHLYAYIYIFMCIYVYIYTGAGATDPSMAWLINAIH
jgi:hypothetical protein